MSSSVMYDVFRLHEIRSKLSYKFESVASMGDLFFLGTSEGKIIVYQVFKTASSTSYECTSIHIQTSKYKQPVRQIVPILEKSLLVVLIGEQIFLHQLQAMDKNQLDRLPGDKMPEIGPIRGAKDIIAFHVKKERGVFQLAAIQKKKVMVYELREFSGIKEFVIVRDGLALPDGIRTIAWAGRGLILGFRKEYVMMDVTTGNIDCLFPTGKSNQPVITNMDPIQELLIGEESAGVRVNLEGEPAAKSGVNWASLPSCLAFFYPFLLSIHDGNSIEVRSPFFIPSSSDARSYNSLCQTLSVKYVDRISARGFVDFDQQKPDAKSDPMLLRKDIIVATNGSSSVFLLEMIPIREQALGLAANKAFEASIDLCRMCPNEVQVSTLNDIKIMFGLHQLAQRKFTEAIAKFKDGDADPRFVVSLFPNFLPQYVKGLWKPQRTFKGGLDARELSDCVQDALQALLNYLMPLRTAHEDFDGYTNTPTDDEGMIDATVDTAILRSLVVLGKEDALLQFLAKPNRCVLEDSETFMKENRQWTSLVALWRGRGAHENSLELLYTLGVCGTPNPGTDHRPGLFGQTVVKIVDDVLSEDGLPLTPLPQREIELRFDRLCLDGEMSDKERSKTLCQLTGIIGALYYLRTLDMAKNSEKLLFHQYCGWILANLDPMYSLTMFTKSVSRHDHSDVVKLLANVGEPGTVTSTQRVAKYLETVMGDQCNNIDDRDLHNERVKALIELVMEERRPEDVTVTPSQKKLHAFLIKSTYYDPTAVVQWLSSSEYAKSFYRERAMVYKRLKQHSNAISMYLNEVGSLEEAKAYATAVSAEEGDAFKILLQFLMKPDANGGVRIREALEVINNCEGVEAQTALPMLPDDTPITALKDFMVKSMRTAQSKRRAAEVMANVLKTRLQQTRVASVRVKAKYALIEPDTTCAECQKKVRPDTVFARYPNGVVVHQACLDNEFVCPHTHRDFRTGVETILHQ